MASTCGRISAGRISGSIRSSTISRWKACRLDDGDHRFERHQAHVGNSRPHHVGTHLAGEQPSPKMAWVSFPQPPSERQIVRLVRAYHWTSVSPLIRVSVRWSEVAGPLRSSPRCRVEGEAGALDGVVGVGGWFGEAPRQPPLMSSSSRHACGAPTTASPQPSLAGGCCWLIRSGRPPHASDLAAPGGRMRRLGRLRWNRRQVPG